MTVTVYTTPACPQCMATKKFLDHRTTAYQVVALEADDAARIYVMDTLGYRAAPVVVVRNENGDIILDTIGLLIACRPGCQTCLAQAQEVPC